MKKSGADLSTYNRPIIGLGQNLTQYQDEAIMDTMGPLKSVTVTGQEVTVVVPMRILRENLMIGQSVRTVPFSIAQKNPHCSKWRYELRIYPAGQILASKKLVVYLVLVECPYDQYIWNDMDVKLTVKLMHQLGHHKHEVLDNRMAWPAKKMRWVRLFVPLELFMFRNEIKVLVSIEALNEDTESLPPRESLFQRIVRRVLLGIKQKDKDLQQSPPQVDAGRHIIFSFLLLKFGVL